MENWSEKSNSDIILAKKTMEQEYEVIKNKILVLANKMEEIETDYKNANTMLLDRLKR